MTISNNANAPRFDNASQTRGNTQVSAAQAQKQETVAAASAPPPAAEVAVQERVAADAATVAASRSVAAGQGDAIRDRMLARPADAATPAVRRGLEGGWLEANGGRKGLKGKGANAGDHIPEQGPPTMMA